MQAASFCGSSASRNITITRLNPGTPVPINGTPDVCPYLGGTPTVTYASGSTNASSYIWTLPTGASGSSTVSSIVVTYSGSFLPGNVAVTAANGCASSSTRTLAIYKIPNQPSTITGTATPCAPSSGVGYSITNLGYTYTWTAPANASIASGQGTASATLNFSASFTSGNVTVAAMNSCGTGSSRTFALTKCTSRISNPAPSRSIAGVSNSENVLFPNPSNGDFSLTVRNAGKTSMANVDIKNEFGQILYWNSVKCFNGIIVFQLRDKLPNGVYVVQCIVNKEKILSKLIISK